MCDHCRRIEAEGVSVETLLDHGLTFSRVGRYNDPVFVDDYGREWTLERHATSEELAWVPAQ